jgi:cellulose 1,4-beta-cellobiosidase
VLSRGGPAGGRDCGRLLGRIGRRATFTVTKSAISMPGNGGPGGYPSLYQGCHWGSCSSGGLAANPVQVSALRPGQVTTSWSTALPGSGVYNVTYDIWFDHVPVSAGRPDCAELMVWLNHSGGIQPFGALAATGISVGGVATTCGRGGSAGAATRSRTR